MIEPARTILVVEDDRDVREIATVVLEEAGYRVLEAESGDDAYRLLLAHPDLPVDALFTDIVMPGRLDGIDIANAARELRPGLRVLYATGFANLVRPTGKTTCAARCCESPIARQSFAQRYTPSSNASADCGSAAERYTPRQIERRGTRCRRATAGRSRPGQRSYG
jgi:CheY-like chemotaxis protein